MSLFGSRENDPLLQDDPFAPSEGEPSDSSSAEDSSPPGGQADEPSASDAGNRASSRDEEGKRVLVRGVDEAEAGTLSALNTAFDQGWRLEKVVHREETADLLFWLRQRSAEQNGLIV